MTTPEAIAAKLESLKDTLARIEAAIIRTNENINDTRHGANGQMQGMFSAQDVMLGQLRDLNANLRGVIEMAASYKAMQQQASGGIKVWGWLWPLILTLAGLAVGGGAVYFKVG